MTLLIARLDENRRNKRKKICIRAAVEDVLETCIPPHAPSEGIGLAVFYEYFRRCKSMALTVNDIGNAVYTNGYEIRNHAGKRMSASSPSVEWWREGRIYRNGTQPAGAGWSEPCQKT